MTWKAQIDFLRPGAVVLVAAGLLAPLLAASEPTSERAAVDIDSTDGPPTFYQQLKSAVGAFGIRSLDDLLAAFPPDELERYALVVDSRSLQKASEQHPRVVVINPRRRVAFAFRTTSEAGVPDSLEIIEMPDARTGELRFHSIQFPPPGSADPVRFEDAPASCNGCHDSRPNWDTYPVWPGVLGSFHNERPRAQELENLRGVQHASLTNPRLGVLPGIRELTYERLSARNTDITTILNRWNALRVRKSVYDRVHGDPKLRAATCDLLGRLYDPAPGGITDKYLWERAFTSLRGGESRFRELVDDTVQRTNRCFQAKAKRYARLHGAKLPEDANADRAIAMEVAAARLLLEDGLGLRLMEWNLGPGSGCYTFSDGSRGLFLHLGDVLGCPVPQLARYRLDPELDYWSPAIPLPLSLRPTPRTEIAPDRTPALEVCSDPPPDRLKRLLQELPNGSAPPPAP